MKKICGILILILLVFVNCGPSEEDYNARGNRIQELLQKLREQETAKARLQEQFDDSQRRVADLQVENERMAGRLQELGEDVNRLRNESQEAQQRAEELLKQQRQQQERLQTYCNMLERFHKMIAEGRLKVRPVRGRMVLELPSAILFESGSADLSENGRMVLTEVAQVLKTINNREFQIVGHTDDRPIHTNRFPSNWELSTTRAVNVVRYLQESGMDPRRLSASGNAEFQPAYENDNEDHRAQNRRIEIVLLPNIEELPDLSTLQCNTPDSGNTTPPAQ